MSVRRSDPALGFRPLDPLRMSLIAVGVPAVSLGLALAAGILLLRMLGRGSVDQILDAIGRPDAGRTVEGAIELSNLLFECLLVAFTLAIAVPREQPWAARTIAWSPWPKDRSFLPFLAIVLVWEAIEGVLIEPRFPQLAELSRLPQTYPAALLNLATLAVAAPIAEEVFFRGFVYTNLRAHMGFPAAIVLSAVYFALLHYESSFVLPLLTIPFGLMAGLVRERYGSVRPAIYLHMIWNLVAWAADAFGMPQ